MRYFTRLGLQTIAKRRFSTPKNNPFAEEVSNYPQASKEVSPAVRRKNLITLFVLTGIVSGIYYLAISKMKEVCSLSFCVF
jgi:hypothetical protein